MPRSPVVSELYKDKIEIVLDNRQIFYLFFGGSVVVGLVFVLGVMVGRRVEARGRLDLSHTQADVDPLAALDRLAGGTGLTFQGALRNPSSPTNNAANSPKSRGENSSTESGAPNNAGNSSADRADPHVTSADTVESSNPGKAAGDHKAEDKKLETKKADAKKSDDKKVEPKKSDDKQVDAKKTEDKKVEDKKAEDKKAEDKKPDAKKPEDKKPESKSKFALQLSSFQSRSEAEAYQSQVKASGFGAYITEADVDGKTYYRVRIGNYRSLDAANSAKAELEKAMKKSATVMKL